ncbi:MAG: hypothetical protein ACTHKB_10640, partial [Burkholderiaceae bacterium]
MGKPASSGRVREEPDTIKDARWKGNSRRYPELFDGAPEEARRYFNVHPDYPFSIDVAMFDASLQG